MNLANTIKLQTLGAGAAGAQATVPDSRSADEWIKKFLDDKNKRLNALRKELHSLLDFPQPVEIDGAYREDKKSIFEQMPGRVAGHGRWAVVSPEGEIISRWDTKAEADAAAWPAWKGIKPSATGASGGARVKRLRAGGPGSGCKGENCGRKAYHGTALDKVGKILKNGLLVNQKPTHPVSEIGKVYLTKTRSEAENWAKTFSQYSGKFRKDAGQSPIFDFTKKKDFAVIEVSLPKRFKEESDKNAKGDKLGTGTDFTVRENVPRENISRVFYYEDGKLSRIEKVQAADIFQDEELGNRTRARFLKHPKPRVVKDADILRMGDRRPSSHGQGAAGAGGTGGPGGAGI